MTSIIFQGINNKIRDGIRFKLNPGIATSPNWYATSTPGDDVNNFGYTVNGTGIAALTNSIWNDTNTTNQSVEWIGLFKPDISGTWEISVTIRGVAANRAYLWLDNNAVTGFTYENADLTLGGAIDTETLNFTATIGIYYPIRLQYFRYPFEFPPGFNRISINYKKPGAGSTSTDWSGLFFSIENGVMRF